MRVVHIIGRMNVGGPAAIVAELLTHLDADVHLLVGEVDGDEADYLELRAPTLEVTRICPSLATSQSRAAVLMTVPIAV